MSNTSNIGNSLALLIVHIQTRVRPDPTFDNSSGALTNLASHKPQRSPPCREEDKATRFDTLSLHIVVA
ncbi:hypothetical protein AV530_020098 [Patagioenas fasciata monilis]|uniref:Uncharacterized protein n=1 Tax=Patagioenas fasciata monilis TaxID=372326 RepID=A0A1V4JI35_PATFA|nr:hypothetical protein AV530_020098 [Patagioenas fasciata monilis]